MSDKVYGIDLGTTYSAVALVNDLGLPEIIKNFEGHDTTPSVVYFNDDGSAFIGGQAKRTQIADPENACALIKRHIGEDYKIEFRGNVHTPETISALILKELVNNANSQNGLDIGRAVITVPAYFGIRERQATRQAGEIAGLEVVGIIPEPVAAAIALGTSQEEEQTLLVFDLGGGTFDTTILKAQAGKVDVVAIDGERLLGGADWDQRLEDLFLEKFRNQAALGGDADPSADDEFMTDLRVQVEDAKKALTIRQVTNLLLRYGDKREKVEITREEFEAATADLVELTVVTAQRVLKTAQDKSPGLTIDRFLLVGGSSRMPMIENALKAAGFSPERTDYDLSVAKGAAIYGQGEVPAYVDPDSVEAGSDETPKSVPGVRPARVAVTNVLPRGVGVQFARETEPEKYEDYIEFLAHANDTLPLDGHATGGILRDGQTSVEVPLYEQGGVGESEKPEDNKALVSGPSTTITGLPPMRKGDPIEIKLHVSEEGIATLSVTEPKTGRSFTAEAAVSVLSGSDVEESRIMVAKTDVRS
ncbi:MAG: Hsp70 family protein [Bifidobacteriaceae bacterium]|jgi:molecular chaperone DnaK (HSP70)|nr:Hsp70 family protein [Bifidobacteriaceae bacterium]